MPVDLTNMLGPKTPCQTPGCNWPNWHVCLVGKPDLFPKLLRAEEKRDRLMSPRTEEHKQAIAEAQIRRWERVREENRERDAQIVKRYAEGNVGIKPLAKEFGTGPGAVRRVLYAAQERGEISVRPKGQTVKSGAA